MFILKRTLAPYREAVTYLIMILLFIAAYVGTKEMLELHYMPNNLMWPIYWFIMFAVSVIGGICGGFYILHRLEN